MAHQSGESSDSDPFEDAEVEEPEHKGRKRKTPQNKRVASRPSATKKRAAKAADGGKKEAQDAGVDSDDSLAGCVFVRVGRIKGGPTLTEFIVSHGGSFEKASQKLKKNVTHLLDGGCYASREACWSTSMMDAACKGIPMIAIPDEKQGLLSLEEFLRWKTIGEDIAAEHTKEGTTLRDYAMAYRKGFHPLIDHESWRAYDSKPGPTIPMVLQAAKKGKLSWVAASPPE